jgi:hypothetical protein
MFLPELVMAACHSNPEWQVTYSLLGVSSSFFLWPSPPVVLLFNTFTSFNPPSGDETVPREDYDFNASLHNENLTNKKFRKLYKSVWTEFCFVVQAKRLRLTGSCATRNCRQFLWVRLKNLKNCRNTFARRISGMLLHISMFIFMFGAASGTRWMPCSWSSTCCGRRCDCTPRWTLRTTTACSQPPWWRRHGPTCRCGDGRAVRPIHRPNCTLFWWAVLVRGPVHRWGHRRCMLWAVLVGVDHPHVSSPCLCLLTCGQVAVEDRHRHRGLPQLQCTPACRRDCSDHRPLHHPTLTRTLSWHRHHLRPRRLVPPGRRLPHRHRPQRSSDCRDRSSPGWVGCSNGTARTT